MNPSIQLLGIFWISVASWILIVHPAGEFRAGSASFDMAERYQHYDDGELPHLRSPTR